MHRILRASVVLAAMIGLATQAEAQTTPYNVALTGVDDGELSDLLQATGSVFRLRDTPAPSPIGLTRRADSDHDRLLGVLHSLGYYDATLDLRVDTGAVPAQVTVAVSPGTAYRIATINVLVTGGQPLSAGRPLDGAALGLAPGTQARAATVIAAEDRIAEILKGQGFAYARVTGYQAVVDHATHTMDVTYTVAPGPKIRFGATRIVGLKQMSEAVVRARLPWHEGDPFDSALLTRAQTDIARLAVFTTVRVTLADQSEVAGDQAPVTVTVAERKRHFVGAALTYGTDTGVGLNGYWGHRNLFGGGEQFKASVTIDRLLRNSLGSSDVTGDLNFRKPDFLRPRQDLILDGAAVTESLEPYDRTAITFTATLEARLSRRFTVSYGGSFENAHLSEPYDRQTTTVDVAGVPLGLTFDDSNDPLNPSRGWRASVQSTPYATVSGHGVDFIVNRATGSAYQDLSGNGDWVLAERVSLGSIEGSGNTERIPADKRFYGGGGSGSIRGFSFQMVGPLDNNGKPIGGRSLVETATELRIKITDTLGIVPFVDGGNVYDSIAPDLTSTMRWGAGIGGRYYTSFGPLRLDLAAPINRRSVDSPWQAYVSIGQAF
ncbi:MAG: autotransporter assembly complex protein TamA [Azospirillaceae bacterium]|nr:autotransporter assembly complex protein TamA [Azospirillaceae bacterium]